MQCRCPGLCARSAGRRAFCAHPELFALNIAHIDCDAFFASVEKQRQPDLADRPVIIGGGKRGVVSTACYIARLSGVRSAIADVQGVETLSGPRW